MTQQSLEILAQQAAAGDKAALDTLCGQIQAILRHLDPDTLNRVVHAALNPWRDADRLETSPPPSMTPELLDWARRQFTEEELMESLRELRDRGGIEFRELLQGIEPQTNSQ